tara:strand:- start:2062 stop:3108 length:1047 start_codon:yes stop_codon:yes gene_type:complete
MKKVSHLKIRNICIELFKKKKVNKKIYNSVVKCLIESSLRGVDTHGIRLLPHYLKVIETGRINIKPKIKIQTTNKTTAILDADHTYGHYACELAVQKAIRMAKKSGSGFVVVKNSTHNSAGAFYSLQPANKGMIGISFAHSTQGMIPTNSREKFFGTNAFSMSFPCKNEEPICLDMATTQISWNKVLNYLSQDKILEGKYAVDKKGKSTNNPKNAYGLLPTGMHKGFGLGMIVEMFCALLANGPYGPDLTDMFEKKSLSKKRNLSQFVGAINISDFTNLNNFKKRSKEMVVRVRKLKNINNKKVMVAGDPEKITKKNRIKYGIPLNKELIFEYNELIKKNNLEKKYLL